MSPFKYLTGVLLAAAFMMLALTQTAQASDVLVTNSADSGAGSLRQAMIDANQGDTIRFDSSLGNATIALASELPIISKTLTIDGRSAPNLTISGNNITSSGFNVGADGNVSVFGLTFADGFVSDEDGGGAFWVQDGILQLEQSTVINNKAGYGGAIFNDSGRLTIINSTITQNQSTGMDNASGGGAIDQYDGGVTEIKYSTLSDNIAVNSARGGIWIEAGIMIVTASVLDHAEGSCDIENTASVISGGYNVDSQTTGLANPCRLNSTGDVTATDPLLSILANNGGAAWTREPSESSPSINRVPRGEAGCGDPILTDQRGSPRIDACDSGAFELLPYAPEISFSAETLTTSESNPTTSVSIVLDNATTLPITLNWQTKSGTATAGEDFTANSGQLTFAAGTTTKTITVSLIDDDDSESDESFSIELSNPSWGDLMVEEAVITIVDNDTVGGTSHAIFLPILTR